jgi:hypothetical protein
MGWTKQPPWKGTMHIGCLSCSTAGYDRAPLDMWIAVGFGDAHVECDGKIVYDELNVHDDDNFWTVADAEFAAASNPDHDWRIVKYGPLHGEVYQRHAVNEWVLIESNKGFA